MNNQPKNEQLEALRFKLEPIIFPYFKHDELVVSQQRLLDEVMQLFQSALVADRIEQIKKLSDDGLLGAWDTDRIVHKLESESHETS